LPDGFLPKSLTPRLAVLPDIIDEPIGDYFFWFFRAFGMVYFRRFFVVYFVWIFS